MQTTRGGVFDVKFLTRSRARHFGPTETDSFERSRECQSLIMELRRRIPRCHVACEVLATERTP